MKKLLLLTMFPLVCSCASRKTLPPVTPSEKDITKVVTLYEVVEVFDTTFINLPRQTAERTTQDSTSTLENDFAKSTAAIKPDGSLFHTLETKPQPVPVPTKKRVERKDSTETRYIEKPVPYPVEVEVNRLTWFQRAQIYTCRVLVALGLCMAVWRNRKKFISIFGHFI